MTELVLSRPVSFLLVVVYPHRVLFRKSVCCNVSWSGEGGWMGEQTDKELVW